MSHLDPIAGGAEACVTASDLVRQFGLWQERALQQPVFVLRRGRPSLVLTSLDLMRRLCAPHEASADTTLAALLMDTTRECVLVIDASGRIGDLNRAARIAFGAAGSVGAPLARLFNDAVAAFLLDLADRARKHGAPEQAEIAHHGRRYGFVLVPYRDETLLMAHDSSADLESETTALRLASLETALAGLGTVAWARINLRGYVEGVSDTLPALLGIDRAALLSVRFVTLAEASARASVADVIEAVIADGNARTLATSLQRRNDRLLAVELSLAAERGRAGIDRIAIAMRTVHDPHNS